MLFDAELSFGVDDVAVAFQRGCGEDWPEGVRMFRVTSVVLRSHSGVSFPSRHRTSRPPSAVKSLEQRKVEGTLRPESGKAGSVSGMTRSYGEARRVEETAIRTTSSCAALCASLEMTKAGRTLTLVRSVKGQVTRTMSPWLR